MKARFYFAVKTPDGKTGVWCGGGLRKSKTPGKIWLTRSDGSLFMEFDRKDVRPTNPAQMIEAYATKQDQTPA